MTAVWVRPATASRWPDVVRVFDVRGCTPNSCWCQRFRRHVEPSNQAALEQEVRTAARPVGLIAYVDDRPAGWSRVVPRSTLPGVLENRGLQRLLDDDEAAWWIACFAVRPEYRGTGVGLGLLQGAIDYAARNGASVLDGHPVDVARLKGEPSPAALFTGTLTTFSSAGFRELGRTYPSRPVMRRSLITPSASSAG